MIRSGTPVLKVLGESLKIVAGAVKAWIENECLFKVLLCVFIVTQFGKSIPPAEIGFRVVGQHFDGPAPICYDRAPIMQCSMGARAHLIMTHPGRTNCNRDV